MITVDFSRLRLRPGDRVLDMGCGSGRHMGELVSRNGIHACGCDNSPSDLADAIHRIEGLDEMALVHADWAFMAADITCLPFRDGAFDLVICAEVLEHVANDHAAVAELTRVLKPGAPLVVSVPRNWPERVCWRLSRAYRTAPGGHLRIYNRRSLSSLFRHWGLQLTGLHYAHAFHAPYWWLKCLFGLDNADTPAVRIYHRFLCWEMMHPKPFLRLLEKALDPLMGKSIVIYMMKKASCPIPQKIRKTTHGF